MIVFPKCCVNVIYFNIKNIEHAHSEGPWMENWNKLVILKPSKPIQMRYNSSTIVVGSFPNSNYLLITLPSDI